jgi:hypothetical protein
VVLLSGDDLKELLHIAECNGTSPDCMELLSKGGSAIPPPNNAGYGMGYYDQNFRQRR